MKAAFIVFDRMTSLDFVGVFDAVGRLKTMGYVSDMSWHVCSMREKVTDDRGLGYLVDSCLPNLSSFDLLVVPGGFGTDELVDDQDFMNWLATGSSVPTKASVCTGALLLGSAGFLKGRAATTHPKSLDALKRLCREVRRDRIVHDGDTITAGGVTSSIDLGLYLVELYAGPIARKEVANQMDYPDINPPVFKVD